MQNGISICSFDIPGITESRLNSTDADHDVHIDGLEFLRLDRSDRKGGESVLYYADHLKNYLSKASGEQRLKEGDIGGTQYLNTVRKKWQVLKHRVENRPNTDTAFQWPVLLVNMYLIKGT